VRIQGLAEDQILGAFENNLPSLPAEKYIDNNNNKHRDHMYTTQKSQNIPRTKMHPTFIPNQQNYLAPRISSPFSGGGVGQRPS